MDGQNFENEQNVTTEQPMQENNYQEATYTAPVTPVVAAVPEKKTDALAITSMVLGIVSIVAVCCLPTIVGIILAVVGIVLSVISKKNNGKSGMATAGLVCSIVAIVLAVITIILAAIGVAFLSSLGMDMNSLY